MLNSATCSPAAGNFSQHCARQLVYLFDTTVGQSHNTRLVGGANEPFYQPAGDDDAHHRIYFTRDYFASALHEVAHWCIAGEQRRQLPDYGYWYAPDGRTDEQQARFEQVEVKPQALEWIFATACGSPFRVSVDNLSSDMGASDSFKRAIVHQATKYCMDGLPPRAARFVQALLVYYGQERPFDHRHFTFAAL